MQYVVNSMPTPILGTIFINSFWTIPVVFVGEGAYEGLIAVVDIATDRSVGRWDLHGCIIDGELPPPPEPVVSS